MLQRNITGVPSFFIGDDVVVGLDKEKILSLVDHRVVMCSSCHKKVRVPINSNVVAKCPNCKNNISI